MATSNARHYDVILAGAGAAGLSLAYRLHQAMPELSMLLIDEVVKNQNDHTWCFWTQTSSFLDKLAYRSWDRLAIRSDDYKAILDLHPCRYTMVRAIDFYRFIRNDLAAATNIATQIGEVETIADGQDYAEVIVNEQVFRADWIFDSRYRPADYQPLTRHHRYLSQHFLGWEIETELPVFDPTVPTLFDFRTPQLGDMRFFYVLPYSERRGLVEYTIFSGQLLPLEAYQTALETYIGTVLGVGRYRVLSEEHTLIPMTDHLFRRRAGQRVLNIGTRGGRVKPSSGFAFERIQRDSAAIVKSLTRHGHPFDIPRSPGRYRTFDAMLLQILERQGHLGKPVFLRLFRRNPVQRVFRFLDEDGGLAENLRLMASVPPVPFIRAWLAVKLRTS